MERAVIEERRRRDRVRESEGQLNAALGEAREKGWELAEMAGGHPEHAEESAAAEAMRKAGLTRGRRSERSDGASGASEGRDAGTAARPSREQSEGRDDRTAGRVR